MSERRAIRTVALLRSLHLGMIEKSFTRLQAEKRYLTLLLIYTSSYAYISHVSAVIANVNYIYMFDV